MTRRIIGAAIEVHRTLGPGLLESVYDECLCYEMAIAKIGFERQKAMPVAYKGLHLQCGYRLDLLVEDEIVVEVKAVEALLPVHTAQVLSYLKASGKELGLLINFNVPVLKDGVRRLTNHPLCPPESLCVSVVNKEGL